MTRASDTARILSGGAVINEDSNDVDFRVESNANANMLVVDAGNDRVGIGTNAPATGNGLVIQNTDGSSGLVLHRDFSGSNVSSDTSTNRIEFTLSDSATANQAIALITPQAAVGSGDALGGILRFFTATTAGNSVERTRITKEGYIKAANDGSYRSATGEFHEFVTTDTGDPAVVFVTSTGSYAGGGVQSIAVTAQGTGFNLYEGYTNNAADREFRVQGDGTVHADGAYSSSGGDYAEMFEWKDGNSSSEDRVGKTVVLDGDKIRLSTSDDAQATIIGVVSARPVVLGDAQDEKWKDKFETDSYGRYIREEYTQTEWRENNNVVTYQTDKIPSDVTVPKDAKVTSEFENGDKLTRRKLNSAFDESKTYVSRLKRKEFSAIGLVGKLRVNVGQTVGDRWIKMREISDTVHEYLVR